jgi:signal peptidase
LGNTKFDVVEEETDKKSTSKKSLDKKKSDKKSTKEVDKETKSTEEKKLDIKEKYKKIKDNLLNKIKEQKDKTKTEEKKTAKTETKTKVKAETKTKTGTKSTKSNNTNKKKKTTPAIEYDDSVRTKRVLKPGVAKAISIILNVLYYIVFLFLVLLLLIVFVQRISNNEFAFGGVRIYNIATQSMASKYDIGDVILAKDVDPSELKVGDDIAYRGKVGTYKDRIITHEIQAISQNDDGSYSIITKGLANDIEDPEINSSQVQGKIVKKLKLLSAISKIASNNFGLFFAIFIPIALIIFVNMIRIINADDDKEENQRE